MLSEDSLRDAISKIGDPGLTVLTVAADLELVAGRIARDGMRPEGDDWVEVPAAVPGVQVVVDRGRRLGTWMVARGVEATV